MLTINLNYNIKDDVNFILESEKINILELSKETKISRVTFDEIEKKSNIRKEVFEKFYSYVYKKKYRINSVKEELIKEKYKNKVLFHGSRDGLKEVLVNGSRNNCDFGNGFYLGESYNQALSFVCEKDGASVYSFRYDLDGLKVKTFDCDMQWMLAICYYRQTLEDYRNSEQIQKIIKEVEDADVIIAPIADNKMFYIMTQFALGEINADVALHSLSASRLGKQFIFKTEKALQKLIPIERYYLSIPEREDCIKNLNERGFEIDTKLKLAKREFKNGKYIEEIFE